MKVVKSNKGDFCWSLLLPEVPVEAHSRLEQRVCCMMERWWPTWCPSTMLWQENTDKITLTHPTLPAEDLWPLCGNPLLVSDDGRLHHLGAYHHPLGLCFLPTSLSVWCSCEEILLFPWGTAQLLLFRRMSFDHRVTGPATSLSQFLPVPFFHSLS